MPLAAAEQSELQPEPRTEPEIFAFRTCARGGARGTQRRGSSLRYPWEGFVLALSLPALRCFAAALR